MPVPRRNASGFLTLTASLYLPLAEKGSVSAEDETRRVRLLRELRWNADRHLASSGDAETRDLIAQKSALLAAMAASSNIPPTDEASHATRSASRPATSSGSARCRTSITAWPRRRPC